MSIATWKAVTIWVHTNWIAPQISVKPICMTASISDSHGVMIVITAEIVPDTAAYICWKRTAKNTATDAIAGKRWPVIQSVTGCRAVMIDWATPDPTETTVLYAVTNASLTVVNAPARA